MARIATPSVFISSICLNDATAFLLLRISWDAPGMTRAFRTWRRVALHMSRGILHIRTIGLSLLWLALVAAWPLPGSAQDALGPLQTVLQEHRALLEKSSRRTIGPAIVAIVDSGLDQAPPMLEAWRGRSLFQRKADGLFFVGENRGGETRLIDVDTGEDAGEATRDNSKALRPNGGVRAVIGAALVQFQLSAPDRSTRLEALRAISRDPEVSHLEALRRSIDDEPDETIKAQKSRLERLLTTTFDKDVAERIAAIESFEGDIGVDARGALNPLLQTKIEVAEGEPPATRNVARIVRPGDTELSRDDAYALLVEAGKAPAMISAEEARQILIDNIVDDAVGGVPVAELGDEAKRVVALAALARDGVAPAPPTEQDISDLLGNHVFFLSYAEKSSEVTVAAEEALRSIELSLAAAETIDLGLDALSLASIYFLAAIGLAVTFWRDGRHQYGAWRIHHDGRLYRICRAALHLRLHSFARRRLTARLRYHLRRRRADGANRHPLALSSPSRDAPCDIRDLHCAPAVSEEHLSALKHAP